MRNATTAPAWQPTIIRDRAGAAGELDGRPRLRLHWHNGAQVVVLLTHTETGARHDAYDVTLTVNGELTERLALAIARDTRPTAPIGLARYEIAWRWAIGAAADQLQSRLDAGGASLAAYAVSFPGPTSVEQRLDTLRIAIYALNQLKDAAA